MTDLARRRVTDPKVSVQLDKALGSAKQLLTLINDILNISKMETEHVTLDRVSFCLSETLNHVQNEIGHRAKTKGLRFHIVEADALVGRVFEGDPARLEQILLNLVGNAVKFTEQGGIVIRALLDTSFESEVQVRFEIEDTGIGIAIEDQGRLFNLFEQGDGTSTRKYGGLGLGLILSKRLAEQMQGNIGVSSRLGVGSTFWFTVRLGVDVSVDGVFANPKGKARDIMAAADKWELNNGPSTELADVNIDDLRQASKVLMKMFEGGELLVFDYLQTQAALLNKASPADYQSMQTALQQYNFDEAAHALMNIMRRYIVTD